MEEVGNRIKKIIDGKKISNSQMADSIDLPRPVLSHILSGRNKASLSVIQKIITGYPEVNPEWLLLGKGDMFKAERSPIQETEKKVTEALVDQKEEESKKPLKQKNNQETRLESIVHFYNDGSFKVFLPKL